MILRSRALGARRGFTLIELLIVILLIAILMGIAVTTFFGARQKAGDRVAQTALTQAVQTALAFAQDNESFANADSAAMQQAEPKMTFVGGTTASTKANVTDANGKTTANGGNSRTVSVLPGVPTAQDMTLAAIGENGACWFVQLHYGADAAGKSQPDMYGVQLKSTNCTATAMSTLTTGMQPNEFPGRS